MGAFRQPRAVWAVAFACVISFMGIGLVDPILPALSKQLDASPSQVSLLFTSYLLVTAVAMLVTNWVSSRLGAKRTLVAGLILIVLFAGLAGTSGSIGGIVGFRAGWGLGNALFIATSLAIIVASASGGIAGAIILYETALGFGIAVGPLLGGYLGAISWRGPFFGVSVLMAVALVLTLVLVPATPKPDHKTSLKAPIVALKDRGLLIMSLAAVCYNWGFFTLLGYAPYPMHLDEHKLGLVFAGWGLLVALFSIAVAPRLEKRFGTVRTLYVNMAGLAVVLAVIGAWTGSATAVIVATIVSGAFIGINNTLTTQAVMTVAKVERPVASASYGFVRFIGGGLAPFVAGKLADHFDMHVPFFVGAVALLLAIVVLAAGRRFITTGSEPAAAERRPVVVAVDASDAATAVTAKAVELAARRHAPIEVLHVYEVDVIGDDAVERESLDEANRVVAAHVGEITATGAVPAVSGHVLRSVADHAATGRLLVREAERLGAQVLVVGRSTSGPIARWLDDSSTQRVLAEATTDVLVVQGTPLTAQP
ncbi:MFS transporter [Dactylosporangium sp. AC04546]|uniref:MFS transporter n=1 Tax=Dactylosporangium sp. AC04546 TaxID=2862460 RepID=UPI001EDE44F8|nr:MFS transporter [Dactylosporangium sp. AC04546]WVK87705.1 MFS transporter [Dactylosporangium sp. AC04546]